MGSQALTSFDADPAAEHNVLGPGVIGHILRHRTIDSSTYAATDRWFSYDQGRSVLGEYNSSGIEVTRHWQDSFGNVLQDLSTGLWDDGVSGWHHNTKEIDAGAELVYMGQRWYSSDAGRFTSHDVLPTHYERPYSFSVNNPTRNIDSDGRSSFTAELFVGLGGSIGVHVNPVTGEGFIELRCGVGAGAGISASPGHETKLKSDTMSIGGYGKAGVDAFVPIIGVEGYAGVSGDEEESYIYGNGNVSHILDVEEVSTGIGAGGSAGFELNIPIQWGANPMADHENIDKQWARMNRMCQESAQGVGSNYRSCMAAAGF